MEVTALEMHLGLAKSNCFRLVWGLVLESLCGHVTMGMTFILMICSVSLTSTTQWCTGLGARHHGQRFTTTTRSGARIFLFRAAGAILCMRLCLSYVSVVFVRVVSLCFVSVVVCAPVFVCVCVFV